MPDSVSPTARPRIVSREEWRSASAELLVHEKAATRTLDALAARRRRMPMVAMPGGYRFVGPDGECSLIDLFAGRGQLIVYQFMDNGPDDYCSGCASVCDNVGRPEHLNARDTSFAVVSNMPYAQIAAFRQRMQWSFPFVSSRGTTFSADCGAGAGFGISAFLRDGEDAYQTYFSTDRGGDKMRMDFMLLDITVFGRQESWEDSPAGWPQTPPYTWWRLHDEY
ncbi:CalU12 protein [Mycobacteroides abscessus]|uniref:CalU12 protein n=4 Tax=Mycobacteroides abscessus TaxID=36809 RepID=A0A0U1C6I0_9MYCO|nr:DUF899 family protein [Mycobacteroides abscessus]ESV60615.1 hypothetical protein L830_1288 [Mycobacteroides abscessus MAB_082312_2258]ESV63889.1 hypothetical protein L833_1268 [Mycobacteroides abscessus MAB_091912_2446]AIC72032.1 hypothetical protein MYCMA_08225 [Mycobacteroides abscessus subsp. massiliense str. GO 06]AMU26362.1 hypothetical protein A3N96_13785 [Mycobacteroides abscessus]AMU31415.1 hypothetical protein A3N97_13115 [Mycobacteroides abscessus]